jgi:hypothetical protein
MLSLPPQQSGQRAAEILSGPVPGRTRKPSLEDPDPTRNDGVYRYWQSKLNKLYRVDPATGRTIMPTPPPPPPPGVDDAKWTDLFIKSRKQGKAQDTQAAVQAMQAMVSMVPKNSPWGKELRGNLKYTNNLLQNQMRDRALPSSGSTIPGKPGAVADGSGGWSYPSKPQQTPPRISTPAPQNQAAAQAQDPGFVNLPVPRVSTPAPSSSSGLQFRNIGGEVKIAGNTATAPQPEPTSSGMR